ncbi:hypothetical protein [Aerococcus kribbianus]|uniref:Membrane protein YkvI n=1 Tax=Aerococcus kribbianus TaxID=2999064 RepID=A0A9X3FN01_9LACT|nr:MULTISPECIES: hypothetical protein [unclassified Aerococcus]MCZ0717415.1 hypothetical protein [Aerococcus sp. YH-aer221]MCZ0725703.1 hypothetical protein [Aerococcus sp. YH-aer222]
MSGRRIQSINQIMSIAFAYVGILTGAGLATGREMLQYFVSFGAIGLAGLAAITILHMLFAKWILSFGSYYQADHHMEALGAMSNPFVAKLLDWSLVFACLVMSFVLIAGAGANLHQQFAFIPAWLGSLVCALAIIGVSYMDFNKVTAALGMFTPLILIMLLIGLIYILAGDPINWSAQFAYASAVPTSLPNITLSTINYFALCLMSSASMLFVLGGNIIGLDNAQKGGLLGGLLTGIVSSLASVILYAKIDQIAGADVPMLAFMTGIHPLLGLVMCVVIFGMIFNSGISVCYAMARRAANGSQRRFHQVIIIIVTLAYILSFVGFTDLVAFMYPVLGYVGMALLVTIAVAWLLNKRQINQEKTVRNELYAIIAPYRNGKGDLSSRDKDKLSQLLSASVANPQRIMQSIRQFIHRED